MRITGLSWFFFSLQIKAFFRNKSLFRNFFSGPLNIQSGLYMTLNRWKKLWFIAWLFTSWSNKRHEIWVCNRCREMGVKIIPLCYCHLLFFLFFVFCLYILRVRLCSRVELRTNGKISYKPELFITLNARYSLFWVKGK